MNFVLDLRTIGIYTQHGKNHCINEHPLCEIYQNRFLKFNGYGHSLIKLIIYDPNFANIKVSYIET